MYSFFGTYLQIHDYLHHSFIFREIFDSWAKEATRMFRFVNRKSVSSFASHLHPTIISTLPQSTVISRPICSYSDIHNYNENRLNNYNYSVNDARKEICKYLQDRKIYETHNGKFSDEIMEHIMEVVLIHHEQVVQMHLKVVLIVVVV